MYIQLISVAGFELTGRGGGWWGRGGLVEEGVGGGLVGEGGGGG